ncbi:hypothetical protein GCM10008927_13630 [Amylibacter ulvae]|uniref:Uncharacterized protein n=1 Tax=Paramylibacter ulvae TaxID=1651968 RepID=A0ABQ3D2D8_9RHOB|nr:hypothetical protein GCM10008927_13630 [Amylibacter ulvae]
MQNAANINTIAFLSAMKYPIDQRLSLLAELGAKVMKANDLLQENSDRITKAKS